MSDPNQETDFQKFLENQNPSGQEVTSGRLSRSLIAILGSGVLCGIVGKEINSLTPEASQIQKSLVITAGFALGQVGAFLAMAAKYYLESSKSES